MSDRSANQAARAEWRLHWPLVVASAMGFSLHSLSSYSLGLFMEPLGREFGWARAEISIVSVIPGILMVLLSPAIGAVVDRYGSRRMALPSIALTGGSIALAGLASGSLAQWMLIWLIYGVVSLGVKTTVWTTAISRAFEAGRGLALGVTLTGTAIAQIAVPPLAQWLIDDFGWRQAYIWLGLGWAAPCFIFAVAFLYDASDRERLQNRAQQRRDPAPSGYGLTLAQALRSRPLQRIGASTLLTMFIGTAIMIHQVPILTASGITRSHAAWLASLAGVAGIIGKLATGWMTDRWNARTIGVISLTVPALAYGILIDATRSPTLTIIAMMIIGYTMGTKLQICAYLTVRYAGTLHYGKVFGVMTSIIGIGGGLGSIAAGAVFDKFGHYDPLLVFGIGSSFVCGGLLFRLKEYPNWHEGTAH
ncbi:MFS transporter [Novosphingobium sp. ZW T3_23]|uniref:MFS transporter n=1 Tax=Novosphingobium sp. ZW T3_23 TaxID=3378084 RepID=UPI0038525252